MTKLLFLSPQSYFLTSGPIVAPWRRYVDVWGMVIHTTTRGFDIVFTAPGSCRVLKGLLIERY